MLLLASLLGVSYISAANIIQDTTVTQPRKWYVPDAAIVQFAGNMGLLAVGPSYDFANKHLAVDGLYGFVPKLDSDEAEHLLTIKGTYKPWEIEHRRDFKLIPLQIGLGLSYYLNDKYPLTWDDRFPKGYYWWSPKVRLLGFAGSSVTREVRNNAIKKIGLYSELGTYDLIVTSWFKDENLTVWDILNISIGTRVSF